jgi:hypothetical protein
MHQALVVFQAFQSVALYLQLCRHGEQFNNIEIKYDVWTCVVRQVRGHRKQVVG